MKDKILIFKYIVNNDIVKLKELLKNNKDLLYIKGHNLQLPIHDACFYGNKEIINIILEYDIKILNRVNDSGMSGYQILTYHPNLLIHYIKKYKPEDIHYINNYNHTILVCYILNANKLDDNILKELNNIGCSLLKPDNINSIGHILEKSCDQLELINKYFKFDLNRVKNNNLISFQLVDSNNLDCLKKLIKLGLDINLANSEGTVLSYAIYKNNTDFIKFLITQNIDFSYTNRVENSYFNFILYTNTIDIKLQKFFLEKMIDINKQNIEGNTTLHIIFNFNRWEDFKDILINKKVDLSIKNKNNKTPLDYVKKKDRNKIKDLFKQHIKSENIDIKLLSSPTPYHTPYSGHMWQWISSAYYILEKYKNIGMPICKKIDKKEIEEIKKNSLNWIISFDIQVSCISCSTIYYKSKDEYHIASNLETCINNVIDKDLIFIGITIIFNGGNHAGILIIDNNKKLIERFETTGINNSLQENDLDLILERKIPKIMFNLTKKQYKYRAPKKYQNLYDFQEIGEKIDSSKYINEAGGFCQAWVFWYLEHKILNKDLDSKELVIKLKNKLLQENKSIMNHIRSYANKLDQYNRKIMSKLKIKKNDIYRLDKLPDIRKDFMEKIIVDLLKIQNIE
jgi:ankyrin repeat protein